MLIYEVYEAGGLLQPPNDVIKLPRYYSSRALARRAIASFTAVLRAEWRSAFIVYKPDMVVLEFASGPLSGSRVAMNIRCHLVEDEPPKIDSSEE